MKWSALWPAAVNGVPRLDVQVEPWTTSQLDAVVWADVLGAEALSQFPPSRAVAMSVPAYARARHLTCGTIAGLPLHVLAGETPLPDADQPTWTYATDGQLGNLPPDRVTQLSLAGQSPYQRMLWTADDLLFYGGSAWLVTSRYAPTASRPAGLPQSMAHLPWDCWEWSPQTGFTDPDGHPFVQSDVVFFPGPHEGILIFAAQSIGQARLLEDSAYDQARRPLRLELHQTTETPLEDDEIRDMIGAVRSAMAETEGVIYTNSAVNLIAHDVRAGDGMTAARNQEALDAARNVSMPALMLDATAQGASLEYQTATGRSAQWLDYGLTLYLDAITARLSMDDVLPRGQRVAFNVSGRTSLTTSPDEPPNTAD